MSAEGQEEGAAPEPCAQAALVAVGTEIGRLAVLGPLRQGSPRQETMR